MSITFCELSKTFWLENDMVTYAFGIGESGMPEHLYFGKTIGHELLCGDYPTGGEAQPVKRRGESGAFFMPNSVPYELHLPLGGDYSEPGLVLRRRDGSRRLEPRFTGYRIFPEKPPIPGLPSIRDGQSLEVYLEEAGIRVILCYTILDDCATVVRHMRIENHSDQPVVLDRAYSFSLPVPSAQYDVLCLHGKSAQEAQIQRLPLGYGIFTADSKRGYSGAVMNPFLALCGEGATEETGVVYGFGLIYSGSFTLKAQKKAVGTVCVSGGINDYDFLWRLEPGERFDTPEAVLVYSDGGIGGMSRSFHTAYREHLIPHRFAHTPRPVVINNWEATRFAFTPEKIRQIIDGAAGTGIDTFVLDDGWFGVRDDITSGLGDWKVNETKLGGSLDDLIAYVHGRGMRFGLWFEPEMVNRNSELYRMHPDWVLRTADEEPVEARGQLVLDLTQQEVVDYIARAVNDVIRSHAIDYVKWDCNRALTEGSSPALPANRQKETFHRQILGLYDLFHKVVEENPTVLFEGCASGGARFDAGILYYFPQIWTSDNTDVMSRVRIQYGTSVCYPPSTMSCHVTESPNRRASHLTPFESRGDLAHQGPTGYELNIAKLTPEEKQMIPGQIAAYREMESLIQSGELYRLSNPFMSNVFAQMFVAADRSKGVLTAIRLLWNYNESIAPLYPRGLDAERAYCLRETGQIRRGSTWMYAGITPKFRDRDCDSVTLHFDAVDVNLPQARG